MVMYNFLLHNFDTVPTLVCKCFAFHNFFQYFWQVYKAYNTAEQILEDVEVNDDLLTHTKEFSQPEVIEVTLNIILPCFRMIL